MNITTRSPIRKGCARTHWQSGFTVIELMVVIAIAGVILAIAGPSFEMIRNMRVKNAASEVQMALMLARSEAIKRNATVSITPTDSAGVWDSGWDMKVGSTVLQSTVLSQVTVSGVTGIVSFNSVGRPNVTLSLTVSAPDAPESRCVSVNSSGRSATKMECAKCRAHTHHLERGFTMVEILVTIVIVSITLIGLAGLQSKLTVSQLESYQRAQGSVMLADMVARFNSARSIATDVATAATGEVGKGDESWLDCGSAAVANKLLCQWSVLLKGSSEQRADGSKAGGPIGMVGCISAIAGSNPPAYRVSVAWQGNTLGYVPANLSCGLNKFGTEPTAADRLGYRRVVSQVVQFASLTGI